MSHLKDPTTQYYTGEYPKQKQPTPGIQAKMTPVPDCGEKTYVGSGRLKDRKALVTGGDSGIGRAAAIAYAREGADVAISYLPVEEEDAQDVKKIIEECGRKAVLLPGDLSDEKFARSLVHEAPNRCETAGQILVESHNSPPPVLPGLMRNFVLPARRYADAHCE